MSITKTMEGDKGKCQVTSISQFSNTGSFLIMGRNSKKAFLNRIPSRKVLINMCPKMSGFQDTGYQTRSKIRKNICNEKVVLLVAQSEKNINF